MSNAAQSVAAAMRHKFEQKCPDCGGSDFVEDFGAGDLICRLVQRRFLVQECGLVVEAHAIDTRSEWRTFSDSDKPGVDPNRVGGPTNALMNENALTTTIGAAASGDASASRNLQRLAARSGGAGNERNLVAAFRGIGAICERLGLVKAIKDRASELYKQANEKSSARGRSAVAVHAAAVYMACRLEHYPRTFKEILAAAPGTTKVDIGRAYTAMKRDLEQEVEAIHPSDYVRRFCSRLGLSNADMKVATQVAEAACPRAGVRENRENKPWDSRSPTSVAAAIICLVAKQPKASSHPDAMEISQASGVAEVTIRGAMMDLETEPGLIPVWFRQ